MKRIFLIILDSFGIGATPDAEKFGDKGANTLKSCFDSGKLSIPNMIKLGLSEIDGVYYLENYDTPLAVHGRMEEISNGKDTTVGHWEIAGLCSENSMPTYPDGFPDKIINEFERLCGRKVICNKPYSGTEVIKDYGEEHLKNGALIVYTSADSVFQIAAHEDIIPPEELYSYCKEARKILVGEHAVGRVIARPFIGKPGDFRRTGNRKDFSVTPPRETLLTAMKAKGFDVISVGKINDIFAGAGITHAIPTHSNEEGMDEAFKLLSKDFTGLAFINLVEFDSVYGHRQDKDGYARALSDFDSRLGKFISGLSCNDMLIITADHGCDPGDESTDHTREFVPLLIYSEDILPENIGTKRGFGTVASLISDTLNIGFTPEACEKIALKKAKRH